MAQLSKITASFKTTLARRMSKTDTTLTISSVLDKTGNAISGFYSVVIDEGTSKEEFISGTLDSASKIFSSLTRGIDYSNARTGVLTLQQKHDRGAVVQITNYTALGTMRDMLNGDITLPNKLTYENTETISDDKDIATKAYADGLDNNNVKITGNQTIDGVKTFSSSPIVPTPTADTQAATKKYIDDIAISGSPTASTETRGIAYLYEQFLAQEQAVPNMTLRITPGTVYCSGDRIDYDGGSTDTITAPTSYPRIDLVYLDTEGDIQVETGVESSDPAEPDSPNDLLVPICLIHNRTGETSIKESADGANGYIYKDIRGIGGSSTQSSTAYQTYEPNVIPYQTTTGSVIQGCTCKAINDVEYMYMALWGGSKGTCIGGSHYGRTEARIVRYKLDDLNQFQYDGVHVEYEVGGYTSAGYIIYSLVHIGSYLYAVVNRKTTDCSTTTSNYEIYRYDEDLTNKVTMTGLNSTEVGSHTATFTDGTYIYGWNSGGGIVRYSISGTVLTKDTTWGISVTGGGRFMTGTSNRIYRLDNVVGTLLEWDYTGTLKKSTTMKLYGGASALHNIGSASTSWPIIYGGIIVIGGYIDAVVHFRMAGIGTSYTSMVEVKPIAKT